MSVASARGLGERILRWDEVNLAYFAERTAAPDVTLFTARRPDAPEFDLALLYRAPDAAAADTIASVVRHFRARGRRPRVRPGPSAAPEAWALRLRCAGLEESDERLVYVMAPVSVHLPANPAVHVERVGARSDAARFAAVQAAGFGLSAAHQAWERELAHAQLAAGVFSLYLATLDGRAVGAARCVHHRDGATGFAALATLPPARGRGVATSLLARIAADARSNGSGLLYAAAAAGEYAAGWYLRLGFTEAFTARTFAARR
jgi:N-acetylglutamate synthase-like GNAT family acetyltransferase